MGYISAENFLLLLFTSAADGCLIFSFIYVILYYV